MCHHLLSSRPIFAQPGQLPIDLINYCWLQAAGGASSASLPIQDATNVTKLLPTLINKDKQIDCSLVLLSQRHANTANL